MPGSTGSGYHGSMGHKRGHNPPFDENDHYGHKRSRHGDRRRSDPMPRAPLTDRNQRPSASSQARDHSSAPLLPRPLLYGADDLAPHLPHLPHPQRQCDTARPPQPHLMKAKTNQLHSSCESSALLFLHARQCFHILHRGNGPRELSIFRPRWKAPPPPPSLLFPWRLSWADAIQITISSGIMHGSHLSEGDFHDGTAVGSSHG